MIGLWVNIIFFEVTTMSLNKLFLKIKFKMSL